MVSLNALPSPGVAVLPEYIASKTQDLHCRTSLGSHIWEITLPDDSLLFSIDSKTMSLSHRKAVSDSKHVKLGEIRKETGLGKSGYYMESSESSEKIWEVKAHGGYGGARYELIFANKAANGAPTHLDYQDNPNGPESVVKMDGEPVALFTKFSTTWEYEYKLTVAEGLDMSLIVGLWVATFDALRAVNSNAAMARTTGAWGAGFATA